MTPLEEKAIALLQKTHVVSLSSVTEQGYPRICAMKKLQSEGFTVWVSTSADANKVRHYRENPKAGILYYTQDDSVTLNGVIEVVTDQAEKQALWQDWLIQHFPGGAADPDFCLLKFTAKEATIYIEDAFETFLY